MSEGTLNTGTDGSRTGSLSGNRKEECQEWIFLFLNTQKQEHRQRYSIPMVCFHLKVILDGAVKSLEDIPLTCSVQEVEKPSRRLPRDREDQTT